MAAHSPVVRRAVRAAAAAAALVAIALLPMGRQDPAHAQGTPVVVRAGTPEAVRAALARPEVACVLVPDEALLVPKAPAGAEHEPVEAAR